MRVAKRDPFLPPFSGAVCRCSNVRNILHGLTDEEMDEALEIVVLADDASPSPALSMETGDTKSFDNCKPESTGPCTSFSALLILNF